MTLRICTQCNEHFIGQSCPHCNDSSHLQRSGNSLLGVALILGLGLSACGEKEDTGEETEEPASEPTSEPSEPAAEPADAPMYGVPG